MLAFASHSRFASVFARLVLLLARLTARPDFVLTANPLAIRQILEKVLAAWAVRDYRRRQRAGECLARRWMTRLVVGLAKLAEQTATLTS